MVWDGGASSRVVSETAYEVRFERIDAEGGVQIRPCYAGEKIEPPLNVRIHRPSERASDAQTGRRRASDFVDVTWVGDASEELDQLLRTVPA